jgi:hypothetical protein
MRAILGDEPESVFLSRESFVCKVVATGFELTGQYVSPSELEVDDIDNSSSFVMSAFSSTTRISFGVCGTT